MSELYPFAVCINGHKVFRDNWLSNRTESCKSVLHSERVPGFFHHLLSQSTLQAVISVTKCIFLFVFLFGGLTDSELCHNWCIFPLYLF